MMSGDSDLVERVIYGVRHASRGGALTWRLPLDTVASLLADVRAAFAEPLATLLDGRRLAFCFPDAPIVYPHVPEEVDDYLDNSTLVLQGLQCGDSAIGRICMGLALQCGRHVTCSVYLSNPGSTAFDFHVDKWDSHIIQLAGRKQFELAGLSAPITLPDAATCLFIPLDQPHRAATVLKSAHLSIAVHPYPL